MWGDACAPEPALDFDAPFLPLGKAVLMWLGGFAFFAAVYNTAGSFNPAGFKKTVRVPSLWCAASVCAG